MDAERCAHCGERDLPGDPLLPFGVAEEGNQRWAHGSCWGRRHDDRAEPETWDGAIERLKEMGYGRAAPEEDDADAEERVAIMEHDGELEGVEG